MDTSNDIHATARAYYLAKSLSGAIPEQVSGGSMDGLLYYLVIIDKTAYWLTVDGLFTPPKNE